MMPPGVLSTYNTPPRGGGGGGYQTANSPGPAAAAVAAAAVAAAGGATTANTDIYGSGGAGEQSYLQATSPQPNNGFQALAMSRVSLVAMSVVRHISFNDAKDKSTNQSADGTNWLDAQIQPIGSINLYYSI